MPRLTAKCDGLQGAVGFCDICEFENGTTTPKQEYTSAFHAFGPTLARQLGAEHTLLAGAERSVTKTGRRPS